MISCQGEYFSIVFWQALEIVVQWVSLTDDATTMVTDLLNIFHTSSF